MSCLTVPPEFVSTPSSRQLVDGSGALLYCNATGNPEPNITWMKGGNDNLLSTSEILNLTSVLRGDNGAVYTCKVQNYLGLVKATAVITVFCEYFSYLSLWNFFKFAEFPF